MNKLHLLCNAHIDPVWLWQWNDGLAETLSTFRVAADFCEQYDGFVFNHNEALLYEWIEEYDPQLFERIKKLVKEKKWIIMGGWYLQPDCVMTSGESILEQINLGREYFKSRFGITPSTAINFDPFGHSRGLVQILKLTGYDSYIFMRPYEIEGDFIWEGFDGSQVIAHGNYGEYRSLKGEALEKIKNQISVVKENVGLCLWGIGNHGGGPSKVDLENINEFIEKADIEMLHSSAENYIKDVDRSNLKTVSKSLGPCMVGCYTSMVRIKQGNRRLENLIAVTEKIMCYAEMVSDFKYDTDQLKKAKKALAFCQFHDILPGTSIKTVEEDSLRTLNYGEEIAETLYTKAFFKLCEGQKKAKDGEIPIMVFNPHPYEIEKEFEVEFLLESENRNADETTLATVYDENENILPTQNEKPNCTFNNDWVKKIAFRAKLKPSAISRFDCILTRVKKDTIPSYKYETNYIEVSDSKKRVRISRHSGLIELYEVNGKKLVENSGEIQVYKDYEDPWGMKVNAFDKYEDSFKLMSNAKANEFIGYSDEQMLNVRVVEDGAVRTKIQAFFEYKRSTAVIEYTIPKYDTYIDVDILLYSNEVNKMIKYKLETKLSGKAYGETAFGREELDMHGCEAVYHKWCGIESDNERVYVINKGIYGGSFTDSSINISLLRTPVYAAHPIEERQLVPHDRFLNHIDMGERRFLLRITSEKNIAREAQLYNESPYAISMFSAGGDKVSESVIRIDDPRIILSSVKKSEGGYVMNLFNSFGDDVKTNVSLECKGVNLTLHFGKFELKTVQI